MKFKTITVRGRGRGKTLGYPTVNMLIPDDIPVLLRPGVYAAHATIAGQKYSGALFYGPAPTFGDTESTLEIYLLDTLNFYVGEGEKIEVETVKFIRDVINFDFPELLIHQMDKDVAMIRNILKI